MAIGIIFGPGGAGKSLYQMILIEYHLVNSRRLIATNMAVKIPEFQAYLDRAWPNEAIDLNFRLRILTRAEARHFWDFRRAKLSPDLMNDAEEQIEESAVVIASDGTRSIQLRSDDVGVVYIIDEAGAVGFNANEWVARVPGNSPLGIQCSWYLDQQRKFGDDVYASTNGSNPNGIAKPFRIKAHEFIKLKNHYQAQFGPFRGMPKFVRRSYNVEPGPGVEPIASSNFYLVKGGLCDCYRTEAGMGVSGGKADIGRRAKGLPIWTVWPMVAAVGACMVFLPWLLGKGLSHSFSKHKAPQEATAKTPEKLTRVNHEVASYDGEWDGLMQVGSSVLVHMVGGDYQTVSKVLPGQIAITGSGLILRHHTPRPIQQSQTVGVSEQATSVPKS